MRVYRSPGKPTRSDFSQQIHRPSKIPPLFCSTPCPTAQIHRPDRLDGGGMDWNLADRRTTDGLKRILATLVGPVAGRPSAGTNSSFRINARRSTLRRRNGTASPAPTLRRHLDREVLRRLRPAEAALRRLIIVAAPRNCVAMEAHPWGPSSPSRSSSDDIGVPAGRAGGDDRGAAAAATFDPRFRIDPGLALAVALFRPPRRRPRHKCACGSTATSASGGPAHSPQIRSTQRVLGGLRLQALDRALDDLPRQAQRFARWRARRDATVAQNKNPDVAGARNARAGHGSSLSPRLATTLRPPARQPPPAHS